MTSRPLCEKSINFYKHPPPCSASQIIFYISTALFVTEVVLLKLNKVCTSDLIHNHHIKTDNKQIHNNRAEINDSSLPIMIIPPKRPQLHSGCCLTLNFLVHYLRRGRPAHTPMFLEPELQLHPACRLLTEMAVN